MALLPERDLLLRGLVTSAYIKHGVLGAFPFDGDEVLAVFVLDLQLLMHHLLHPEVGLVGKVVGFLKLRQNLLVEVVLHLLLKQPLCLGSREFYAENVVAHFLGRIPCGGLPL